MNKKLLLLAMLFFSSLHGMYPKGIYSIEWQGICVKASDEEAHFEDSSSVGAVFVNKLAFVVSCLQQLDEVLPSYKKLSFFYHHPKDQGYRVTKIEGVLFDRIPSDESIVCMKSTLRPYRVSKN